MESVYDIGIKSIDGQEDMLSSLKGKVCLFVNIATKAGYEPKCSKLWSYARTSEKMWELQQVHEMFDNFSVVGFPCNQFYGMEPLGNEEIHKFIKDNYPFVTFPISEKIEVNGTDEHQVFTFIKGNARRRHNDTMADMSMNAQIGQSLANETVNRVPSNYEKFVIGKNGKLLMRFRFSSSPLADESETLDSHDTIKSSIKIALDIP